MKELNTTEILLRESLVLVMTNRDSKLRKYIYLFINTLEIANIAKNPNHQGSFSSQNDRLREIFRSLDPKNSFCFKNGIF